MMVACSLMILERSLPMRASGGKHHGVSFLSGSIMPSWATAFGSGFQDTNLGNCLLSRDAKRSTVWGPQRLLAMWKKVGLSLMSVESFFHRDSLSARSFSRPGRWTAMRLRPHC